MSVKPILFSIEMVRAILDGRKTVTRRVVKPQPEMQRFGDHEAMAFVPPAIVKGYEAVGVRHTEYLKSLYQIGDILYVRETWARMMNGDYWYKADGKDETDIGLKIKWRPSIHMPREAARIFLRVTGVRVERLQEIDEDGIRAEGLTSACVHAGDMEIAAQEFALLWDSTIKPADLDCYGWDANPWVWVIEFERCEKPEEA